MTQTLSPHNAVFIKKKLPAATREAIDRKSAVFMDLPNMVVIHVASKSGFANQHILDTTGVGEKKVARPSHPNTKSAHPGQPPHGVSMRDKR